MNGSAAFPAVLARDLAPTAPEQRWLIEGLWGADSVGIIGGEPKSFKSFLALGMAVSLASGRPCLDRFGIPRPGRVLLFAAEDALHVVRERLDGICAHMGLDLSTLDLWVMTCPVVRLDRHEDRQRLANTVGSVRPALLVLDPFVRLHAVDENVSAAVAPLLGCLREIQRRQNCAVAVVHHARKGASHARAGQALRGSSEFHAWGDSNLYIQRSGDRLMLSIEHRAQPSCTGLPIHLDVRPPGIALVAGKPADDADAAPPPEDQLRVPLQERILEVLRSLGRPVHLKELRQRCKVRAETLCHVLDDLVRSGSAVRSLDGWHLPARVGQPVTPPPAPAKRPPGPPGPRQTPLPIPDSRFLAA